MSESLTALLPGPGLLKELSADAPLPSSLPCPVSLSPGLLLSLLLLLLVPKDGHANEGSDPSGFSPASEPEPPAAAETLKNAPTYACPLHIIAVIRVEVMPQALWCTVSLGHTYLCMCTEWMQASTRCHFTWSVSALEAP